MLELTRPVLWLDPALKDFRCFPEEAQSRCVDALTYAAEGYLPVGAKPLRGLGSGVFEVALRFHGGAYRVVYAVQLGDAVWVVHAFQKKSTHGIKTPKHEIGFGASAVEALEGGIAMKRKIKAFGGSGNVFRDFGYPDADVRQLKCLLAVEILRTLDREGMTVRAAAERTGTAAADFSRIRKADLGRFTVDRLMTIVHRLGGRVEVDVKVKPARPEARA